MSIDQLRNILREEHNKDDLVDCLVMEIFAQRKRRGELQDLFNDLNNRVRYLEFINSKREL